jgi:LacI family transcriptional regulator
VNDQNERRDARRERRRLQSWLSKLRRPTGIFCGTDWDATFVYEACDQLGVRVGEEIALVGVGNETFYCETFNPPLSSVDVQSARIGYEAADLLMRILKGKPVSSKAKLIEPLGVVARQSSNACAVEDRHVATVMRFIHEHFDAPISVRDLVRLVPLSRRVLERRFRQCLNRSILAEIHRLKLERIQRLLATSDNTIDEIATICGFSQATHMTTLFRQKTGTTPRDYRNQFRIRRMFE